MLPDLRRAMFVLMRKALNTVNFILQAIFVLYVLQL